MPPILLSDRRESQLDLRRLPVLGATIAKATGVGRERLSFYPPSESRL
jgi:hypothetical protein